MSSFKSNNIILMSGLRSNRASHTNNLDKSESVIKNQNDSEHDKKKKYGHTIADVERQILDWQEEQRGKRESDSLATSKKK